MKACFPIWILLLILLSSCGSVKKNRPVKDFQYEDFKATVVDDLVPTGPDTMNVLDTSYFIPETDSVDGLFLEINSLWSADLSAVKNDRVPGKDGRKFFNEQSFALHTNIRNLNSFKSSKKSASGTCREKECLLVAELVTVAGDEISLPFRPPFTDKKGHRDELVRILPAFMATYYWYDLHIDDVLLDAARKL